MMPSLSPRQAIEQWHDTTIDGAALMRALVSYTHWSVPISETAVAATLESGKPPAIQFSRDPEGVARLYLFSDAQAYKTFNLALGSNATPAQHFLETTGTFVFQLPLKTLDEIVIDPATDWEVQYKAKQFPALREIARAVEIEEILADLRAGTAPDASLYQVKQYQKFTLVLVKSSGALSVALAPDEQNRALAAVFTTDDALELYLEQAPKMYPGAQLLTRTGSGSVIFGLLKKSGLDGVVFNCQGPTTPVAFGSKFAAIISGATPTSQ